MVILKLEYHKLACTHYYKCFHLIYNGKPLNKYLVSTSAAILNFNLNLFSLLAKYCVNLHPILLGILALGPSALWNFSMKTCNKNEAEQNLSFSRF